MFKIGMKVVCVKQGDWVNIVSKLDAKGPECGKIYEVDYVDTCNNATWICLKTFPKNHAFDSKYFRPVQDQYTEEEIEAVNIDELTKEKELVEN